MRAKKLLSILMLVLVVSLLPFAFAQEDDDDEDEEDLTMFGFEAEEFLALISAHLALALAFFTFLAYARTKRTKLLYVGFAFSLFAIRLFFEASELFINEIEFLDPLSVVIDFVILVLFFIGMIKK